LSKLVRELFPPLILRVLQSLRNSKHRHKSSIKTYDDVMLAKHVVWRNEIFKSTTMKKNLRIEDIAPIMGIAHLAERSESLTVLDFGGGGGNHKTVANIYFPRLKFKWIVVETVSMCAEAEQMNSDPNLIFISNPGSINRQDYGVDLLIVSSSIQYTEKPLATLRSLLELKPRYIQISRTPVNNTDTNIIYTQESLLSDNGPGHELPEDFMEALVKYPITVIPWSQLIQLLEEEYEILFVIDEGLWDVEKFGNAVQKIGVMCRLKTDG
jgi:putative methyltransferase (TIGR04325 family)